MSWGDAILGLVFGLVIGAVYGMHRATENIRAVLDVYCRTAKDIASGRWFVDASDDWHDGYQTGVHDVRDCIFEKSDDLKEKAPDK